jgi:hypothetical protein
MNGKKILDGIILIEPRMDGDDIRYSIPFILSYIVNGDISGLHMLHMVGSISEDISKLENILKEHGEENLRIPNNIDTISDLINDLKLMETKFFNIQKLINKL